MTTPALLAIALLLVSSPAKGDIILSIEDVTGAPGSSGTFDVFLTNDGSSTQSIAAFNFVLTTADGNVTFTDVTTDSMTAPYIFPVSGSGPDIVTVAAGQMAEAGDFDGTFNGTDVAPGATYGLGSVAFSIAAGAMNGEVAEIDFTAYPFTSLSDSDFNNVDFTAASGTITVQTTSSAVPEPSTALPVAALIAVVLFAHKGRRRTA